MDTHADIDTLAEKLSGPHIDIDFMEGSLHFRPHARPGSQTRPMELGRAARIRAPVGVGAAEVAAAAQALRGQLDRIRAGFGTAFEGWRLVGRLDGDAQRALAEVKEKVASMP